MTTTTPESRGRIAYTAYCMAVARWLPEQERSPLFDELPEPDREGWTSAAQVIWDLAKTGQATIRG